MKILYAIAYRIPEFNRNLFFQKKVDKQRNFELCDKFMENFYIRKNTKVNWLKSKKKKVYYKENEIIFSDSLDYYPKGVEVLLKVKNPLKAEMEEIKNLFLKTKQISVLIFGDRYLENFSEFSEMFKTVDAAGGIVVSNEGRILMIMRNNHWDLPKGKVEDGESVENAAIREVMEETGIGDLAIKKKLGETYHIYEENDSYVLKRVYWYEMKTENEKKLPVPQIEEGIKEVAWVDQNQLPFKLENSYKTIADILMPYLFDINV